MKSKRIAPSGARSETAHRGEHPAGGDTTRGNELRTDRKSKPAAAPVVTVRLVLKALAEVLWVEGNAIQQVRRNRHLLIEAFDVESGPRDAFLAAVEAPVEVFDNFGVLKGEHAWYHDELERRVVEQIAKWRAWKALSKGERRAIIRRREAEAEAIQAAQRAS